MVNLGALRPGLVAPGVEAVPRPELVPLIAVGLATLAAAATDLWKFKVYNALTVPTFALGLACSAWLGGWGGLGAGLLGAGLGFATLVAFFAMGGVGAGDVKLLTAVGAWLGPFLTYQVFVASALAAGAYAVALVILRRGGVLALAVEILSIRSAAASPGSWRRPAARIEDEVRRVDRRRRLVPFAAMTCVGFFATMTWWRADLDEVWPPYDRRAPIATASASVTTPDDDGGTR